MLQNQLIQEFLKFCLKYLKDYKQVNFFEYPKLTLTVDKNKVQTLASFNPSTNEVICYTPKRLVADVFRSVAHELVHFAQNVKQELTPTSGDTGSPIENEANSLAGIILRDFGKKFPQIFVTSFDELVSRKCDTNISDKYETMLNRKYETDDDINNAREQNEEYLKKLFPIAEEDKKNYLAPNQAGFRAGHIEGRKPEDMLRMDSNRSTGHFGTGYYFFGSIDQANQYSKQTGNRDVRIVNFNDYRLFVPNSEYDGIKLHDFFKKLNNNDYSYQARKKAFDLISNDRISVFLQQNKIEYDKYALKDITYHKDAFEQYFYDSNKSSIINDFTDGNDDRNLPTVNGVLSYVDKVVKQSYKTNLNEIFSKEILPTLVQLNSGKKLSPQQVSDIAKLIFSDYRIKNHPNRGSIMGGKDTLSTRIMKYFGWEGIDVRGMNKLDNSDYGSVIYDIKPSSVIKEEDKSIQNHKVFLGGTCANTTWRDEMIPKLKIEYFNPVVKDWTPKCQEIEKVEKNDKCDIHFYLISKEMQGVFSIAEVVDSVHNKDKHTILQIVPNGFDKFQLKSLKAVVDLINERGGKAFLDENLDKSVDIINNYSSKIINETFFDNIVNEETSHKYEYGCLMLDLKFKNWDKFVNSIPEDKLYNEEGDRTFGRELEPHCTVLYGFTKNTDVNKIKNSIKTLKSPIKLSLDKIDIFENEKYDVVKFNVISKDLHKLHKVFKQNFENEESYPNYQPHVTIAYVQKGFGEKFVKTLKQPIELESGIFTYSESNGSKHKIEIDNLEELLQVAEYFLSKNGDGTYENFDKVRKEYFLNEECECEDIEDDEINELLTHIKQQIISEALYQGHSVQLNKPMRGDVKKFKVYVKNKSGKIVKVNFGSKEYNIKKNNPDRKKSYCSRSKGIEGGGKDRTKANYWSRRMWNC